MVQRASLPWDRLTSFSQYWTGKEALVYYMSTSKAFHFQPWKTGQPSMQIICCMTCGRRKMRIACMKIKIQLTQTGNTNMLQTAWAHFNHSTSDPAIWLHFKEKASPLPVERATISDYSMNIKSKQQKMPFIIFFATCQQALGLNIEQVTVWISGQITVNSSFYQLLYRFIPKFIHYLQTNSPQKVKFWEIMFT